MNTQTGLCANGYGTRAAFFNVEHWNRVKAARGGQRVQCSEIELSPGVKLVTMFNDEHWNKVKAVRLQQGLG